MITDWWKEIGVPHDVNYPWELEIGISDNGGVCPSWNATWEWVGGHADLMKTKNLTDVCGIVMTNILIGG